MTETLAIAERLRAAQQRLDEETYQEDLAYTRLRHAREAREKAATEVIRLQEEMIDTLRTV
jgi:hypothetical protein